MLAVNNHVEWSVAVSEFSDRCSLDFVLAGKFCDGDFDEWSAGIASEQTRFTTNVEGHKRLNGSIIFRATMGCMENFDPESLARLGKGEIELAH